MRSVTPDYPLRPDRALTHFSDPLVSYQWWIPAIGADKVEPPGPGIPITVIDTGLDTSHEEFSTRPNTSTLNSQVITALGEEFHGTAVASVAAAPTNGVGVVGVYPQAALQAYDASPNAAGQLTVGDEVRGLVTAIGRGRSVINLSLGASQYLPIEEEAVLAAFGTGTLVVVAAGNEREKGNPLDYPASYSHVLTVGSTGTTDAVSHFSNRSPFMDLAAPGESIPAAIPESIYPGKYSQVDGTSFSTPLVAGASAAVWTSRPTLKNTQLFDLMRWTARDVAPAGWDPDTGFGVLDIPAATSSKAPAVDPQEPNEDVFLVKPKGLFRSGHAPLTAAGHGRTALSARLDSSEDPEDVYRVWVPKKSKVTFSLKPNANVNVAIWGPKTKSVFEKGKALKRPDRGRGQARESAGESVRAERRAGCLRLLRRVPRQERRRRRLRARDQDRSTVAAAYSQASSSSTCGLRTRTRTRSRSKRSRSASATAAARASSRWNWRPSETSRRQATTAR